ncbi:MAG TPA: hypothetical protein VEU30_12890 [Thermoanaerobaculia bacterium]|nr:hypothetical protein [Thermoanaerobaculia bacterium]
MLLSNPGNATIENGEAVVTLTHAAAIPSLGTLGLMLLAMGSAVAAVVMMRA